MLGLTSAGIRRTLGVTLKELAAEDWRKLLQAGQESSSQALGRAGSATGASGPLVRSAAVNHRNYPRVARWPCPAEVAENFRPRHSPICNRGIGLPWERRNVLFPGASLLSLAAFRPGEEGSPCTGRQERSLAIELSSSEILVCFSDNKFVSSIPQALRNR